MNKKFNLRFLMFLLFLVSAIKGLSQLTGDFQTKNPTGNWSDFNAWNIYNGASWQAATTGQIPTATSNVYVQAGQTISVDNGSAVCNDLDLNTFGSNTSRIGFAVAASILNVKGNIIAFKTSPNCFGTWTPGAKIVFSGTGAQGFTNLSANSVFVNIEVNKPSGTLTISSNFKFDTFTLTSGNLTVSTPSDIEGTTATSTININGGVWTQITSTTRIYSTAPVNPSPLSSININGGSMILQTSTGITGFDLSSIDVTNGGTLTLNHFTAGGVISINSSINIDATSTFNTALTTTPLPGSVNFLGVVNYNYTAGSSPWGAQTIAPANYSYLKLSGNGVKTLGTSGTTTIPANGSLEMSGDNTVPAHVTTLATGGPLLVSNIGTKLLYTSFGAQTASSTEWDANFQNITIDNSAGVTMSGLSGTILGSLNLVNGTLNIGTGGALTLDGVPLNRTNGYISGTSTSDFTVTGTTGGAVLLPLPAATNISLRNITIAGTRTLAMDGLNNINLYGTFTVAGGATYDNGGESQIINGGGGSISITGKFITRDIQGFYGSNTAIPGILPALNSGSTVEYGLLGDQTVQGGTLPPYYNVTFSGSGTKTLQSANIATGTITVSGAAIFNAQNFTFGGTGTKLTMSGSSTYKTAGTTAKPDATGTYSLGLGTTIEFTNVFATEEMIRTAPDYANIVVSGSSVADHSDFFPALSIKIQAGGSFTVTNTGTFKVHNINGFSGGAGTSIANTNNPSINLQANSTIQYNRNDGTSQQITNSGVYQNLSLAASGIKTAPAGILTVQGNLDKSGAASFAHNDGSVLLNGANQTFAGLTYNNLILTNNTKTTAGSSTIIDSIKINDGTTLSISGAPDTITLHSDALKTARVGQLGTGVINYNTNGKFLVERYIPAVKAWRFLAVPVKSTQTIKDAWQEGALNSASNPKPGYGTQLTSNRASWAADGFDLYSFGGTSMKAYNATGDNYTGITSTLNSFDPSAGGYMTFIRGNRAATMVTSPVSSTTLRMTGQLFTGDQPAITLVPGQFIPVNNPYASQIDLRSLSQSASIFYYVWDPNMSSTIGYGAFRTFSWNGTDYDVTPANAGSYGATNNYISSGQAFLVAGTGPPVQITEKAKTSAPITIVPFTPVGIAAGRLRTDLYAVNSDGSQLLADGILCVFGDDYSNLVDDMDARKNANSGENLSLKNNGALLAVERRRYPTAKDTIFLHLAGTTQRRYRLHTILSALNSGGADAFLEDTYLHTRNTIYPGDTAKLDFTITADAASYAPGRFRIVFQAAQGPLPLTLTNVKAYTKNESIAVEWTVENETGMKSHLVEKSTDRSNFRTSGIIAAHNNGQANPYSWLDGQPLAGYNYYRVKSVGFNGQHQYSKVVKVWQGSAKSGISVSPNPSRNGIIHLLFNNQPAGQYAIRLINKTGQVILSKQMQRTNAGKAAKTFSWINIQRTGFTGWR